MKPPASSREGKDDADARGEPVFAVDTSRGFVDWLRQQNASLAVTTYQVGKLLLFGVKPDGGLWVFNRNIGRCLGLGVAGEALWITGDTQIFKFVDAMAADRARSDPGHDAFFAPRAAYFTGDLDVHDLAIGADGQPVFANTLFNCLAAISDTHSFEPLWRPAFISRLAAEDRCHLNGLALRDGRPAYVTCVSTSDTFDGWRDRRHDGGVVIDVVTGDIVCEGLSMPHSPRWRDGRLWLHNSGTGDFGWVDLEARRFVPLAFCPGYLRGLTFIGDHAVVGLSKPRDNKTFSGLALDSRLTERRMEARCGLYVIDLRSGDIAHALTIEGVVSELYDVAAIPGKTHPAALGPTSPELRRTISLPSQS